MDTFQEEYQLFVHCLFVEAVPLPAGHRRYLANLPQGGLEIPCILNFVTNNYKEGKKAKQLIESTLYIDICEELKSESAQLQSTSRSGKTKLTNYYLV